MSDEDYFDHDEEMYDLYSDSESSTLTPEEVFKMVMVDKATNTKLSIQLEDADTGDIVELSDVVAGLVDYLKDKMSSKEPSDLSKQICPLMAQAMVSGLGRMLGMEATAFYLSNESTRYAIIYMTMIGFMLLKYIQEHNLLISTFEEQVEPEDIENLERRSRATSVTTLGTLMGLDPKEMLNQLLDQGMITEDDMAELITSPKDNKPDDN